MARRTRARTLKQNGYRKPQLSDGVTDATFVKGRRGKNYRPAQFKLSEKSYANWEKNVNAYIKTMNPANIRPLLEKNAKQYIVNKVRPAIPVGLEDHQYGSLKGRSKTNRRAFRILRGNMQKSYQVLTHRKKFRADNVVFVGPKAYFRKSSFAAVYGRSPKNTNAFYAPAREAKRPVIGPALRSAIPGYFNGNKRMIKKMMRP